MKSIKQHSLKPHKAAAHDMSDPEPEAIPSREDLFRIMRKWQARLKLLDWDIRISWGALPELGHCLADVQFDEYHLYAEIRVMQPEQAALLGLLAPADIEHSILHELLHVRLSDIAIDEATEVHEERAINCIAQALLEAERGDTLEG